MKATVAEVFEAFQRANRISGNAAQMGKSDEEATGAISVLTPVLRHCNILLELDEKQAGAIQKYEHPVSAL